MRPAHLPAAVLAAVLLLLVFSPKIVMADDPPAPPAAAPALSPMMQEIRGLLDEARARLAELEAVYSAASGAERDALEKQIATLKIETEIAVLETQIRYARAAGRSGDDVRRLEESVAALRGAPRPKASPRPRAEPGAGR